MRNGRKYRFVVPTLMSLSLTLVFLYAVDASASVDGSAGDGPFFYTVTVRNNETIKRDVDGEGSQKERLTRFVERLRRELKVDNLGEANVGCDRCGELVQAEYVDGLDVPGRELAALEFTLYRDGLQLEAFARSFQFVQMSELKSETFTMEVSGMRLSVAACPAQAVQWGCRTRVVCPQTNNCDKPYGGACGVCKP